MNKHHPWIIFLVLIFCGQLMQAQAVLEKYWVAFTDKDNNEYSIDNPEEFLSQRSIDRRTKQNIAIDIKDLPVSQPYLDSLVKVGARVLTTSKWLNGATIETDSFEIAQSVAKFSFVDSVTLSWTSLQYKSLNVKMDVDQHEVTSVDTSAYGASFTQLALNNHHLMHDLGYRGEGMLIAVLDGGFYNVDILPAFDSLRAANRIIGTRDFVNPKGSFYDSHYHGMMVLSCMAGIVPQAIMGSAPDASYYLMTTEDGDTEFPVEMDNWVAGAELADSVGADIINSSLGYSYFDYPFLSYTYEQLDGNTTRVTRGADIAASRGILVANSAGNEGNKLWEKIIAPSDGDSVLCVGSMDQDSTSTYFSSRGPSADGRVKPNVLANGRDVTVQSTSFTSGLAKQVKVNGTSFSSPLMAGMAACLWQSMPDKSAMDIKEILERSSHLYDMPNDSMGFGIANIHKAFTDYASAINTPRAEDGLWLKYLSAERSFIVSCRDQEFIIELFDLSGRSIMVQKRTRVTQPVKINLTSGIENTIVIARITTPSITVSRKFIIL